MYRYIREFLFRKDPEDVHDGLISLIRAAGEVPYLSQLMRKWILPPGDHHVDCLGMRFPNPVGLAAGYDKDGLGWKGLAMLGFGHLEVGTVTPEPQAGNPRPRIFRLPSQGALINRMGFPGRGSDFVRKQLVPAGTGGIRDQMILGVNIGKNKSVSNRDAVGEYVQLLDAFAPLADYLAVNVSSPNTIGLRRLQARENLEKLLEALLARRDQLCEELGKDLPVLVKLSPDLDDPALDDALGAVVDCGAEGVIAVNTTIRRPGDTGIDLDEEGGLSGKPLGKISTAQISKIARRTRGRLPIIGVGGIFSPEDAQARLDAGASLVQVYTGLVYRGPLMVRRLITGLGEGA